MESHQTLDENFELGLNLTTDIREFLRETAKWAHFLAIVGFVMVGFLVLIALFFGTFMNMAMSEIPGGMNGFPMTFFVVFYLILAGICVFPALYLLRFATNTKRALQVDDQIALSVAFENLKSHYKFAGICTIVFIGFYVLIIFFSLFASL